MQRCIALTAAVLFAAAAPADAQRISSDTALASMVRAERAFAQHSLRSGTQDAFLRYMAPAGFLYRPRVVRAHAFLKARPMPPGLALTWAPAFADISAAGDLGYTTGPWVSTRRDMPDAPPTFGQYVTIWRRQADGAWKAELDLGVAHDPDPIGPPQNVGAAPAPAYRSTSRDTTAHLRTLLAADSAFDAAARAQSAAAAFVSRAGPDLRLLRMGRFPLTADTAISVLRATPAYRWRPVGGAVSRSGDFGYTYGVYSNVQPNARGDAGDYLRIFRRDRSGAWQVVLDATSPAR